MFNKDKDFEICALKIPLSATCLLLLCVYRSPSGDFSYFLEQLESVLNKLYKISTNIILCGDFNVNFFDLTPRVSSLELLLICFGLVGTVKFHTRSIQDSHSVIDNIFLDMNRFSSITYRIINGISDHDAQIVVKLDLGLPCRKHLPLFSRVIDEYSVSKFTKLLSYESCDTIFQYDNINTTFNVFSDTYFKIFQTYFPLKKQL